MYLPIIVAEQKQSIFIQVDEFARDLTVVKPRDDVLSQAMAAIQPIAADNRKSPALRPDSKLPCHGVSQLFEQIFRCHVQSRLNQ